MKTKTDVTAKTMKRNGFTLIEVIAVLVLLGILAAMAIPKYMDLQASAKLRAVDAGISELNAREALTWSKEQISSDGWQSDSVTNGLVDQNLGSDFTFSQGLSASGGTLRFQGNEGVLLARTASTESSAGRWARQ